MRPSEFDFLHDIETKTATAALPRRAPTRTSSSLTSTAGQRAEMPAAMRKPHAEDLSQSTIDAFMRDCGKPMHKSPATFLAGECRTIANVHRWKFQETPEIPVAAFADRSLALLTKSGIIL